MASERGGGEGEEILMRYNYLEILDEEDDEKQSGSYFKERRSTVLTNLESEIG